MKNNFKKVNCAKLIDNFIKNRIIQDHCFFFIFDFDVPNICLQVEYVDFKNLALGLFGAKYDLH